MKKIMIAMFVLFAGLYGCKTVEETTTEAPPPKSVDKVKAILQPEYQGYVSDLAKEDSALHYQGYFYNSQQIDLSLVEKTKKFELVDGVSIKSKTKTPVYKTVPINTPGYIIDKKFYEQYPSAIKGFVIAFDLNDKTYQYRFKRNNGENPPDPSDHFTLLPDAVMYNEGQSYKLNATTPDGKPCELMFYGLLKDETKTPKRETAKGVKQGSSINKSTNIEQTKETTPTEDKW